MAEEMTRTVTLKLTKGFEFMLSFDGSPDVPPILLDEPPPLGRSAGPNAAALLAGAIANCLAASLLFCLRKSRVGVDAIQAHATARLVRTDTGRLRIGGVEVRLDPTLATDELARFARCTGLFEDFCVVTESVRHGIPVQVTVAAVGRDTPPVIGTDEGEPTAQPA